MLHTCTWRRSRGLGPLFSSSTSLSTFYPNSRIAHAHSQQKRTFMLSWWSELHTTTMHLDPEYDCERLAHSDWPLHVMMTFSPWARKQALIFLLAVGSSSYSSCMANGCFSHPSRLLFAAILRSPSGILCIISISKSLLPMRIFDRALRSEDPLQTTMLDVP